MILAGDIGGTKTRLALFDGFAAAPAFAATYPTAAFSSAGAIVEEFVGERPARIGCAGFAVAGVVRSGVVAGVNLPWEVDGRALARTLDLQAVALVNDLEANARGVAALRPHDLVELSAGEPDPTGNRAVVSAGTGLGEAVLWWDGRGYQARASEGGHADFAPRSELEVELYRFLAAELGHVSYERVVSGAGLSNIYRFLSGETLEPAAITAAAEDRSSTASRAVDLFAAVYGARAGNVALAYMATGGVYLGGGIAPKLVDRLREGAFMDAFTQKGRMSALLERIPVRVILDADAALHGAARIAAERAAA